ncbi:MAG: hypothetical protein M3N98_11660 [Actinomycetota bacterium]|nr:hypothetical protein [Actinomycetota bacterium]
MMSTRLIAIPDTDGELVHLLGGLEEVLLHLVPGEDEHHDDTDLPAGLGIAALAAVQAVSATVAAAERHPAAELYASDSRLELIALRFVELDEAELAALSAAVAGLAMAVAAGHDFVAEVLSSFADAAAAMPCDLVAGFYRAHRLLDVTADLDTAVLADRLAGATGPVVLKPAEQAAYNTITDRAVVVFHLNDPLARFLYRGP